MRPVMSSLRGPAHRLRARLGRRALWARRTRSPVIRTPEATKKSMRSLCKLRRPPADSGNNCQVSRGDGSLVWAEPDVGSVLLSRVQRLGDSFASTVGHLPFAAWDEYAKAGHVLAVIDESAEVDNSVMAYVAYRLPRDEVVIAQLVVDSRYRGLGLARAMIDELSSRYHGLRGIRLRCRRDFVVNRMWPHLGFVSRGERPGRRIGGSTLTEWWRDHGHMDLMSWQGSPPQVIPVLVDSNVFFDLHPPGGAPCPADVQLLKDLDGDRLDILLSPETLNEIQRNPDTHERSRLRSLANSYPRLVVNPTLLAQWEERIRALVGSPLTAHPKRGCSNRWRVGGRVGVEAFR